MDTVNPGRGHILISCTIGELSDLRWLIGIAMQQLEENQSERHLELALNLYKSLHLPGCAPTPQLYLKRFRK